MVNLWLHFWKLGMMRMKSHQDPLIQVNILTLSRLKVTQQWMWIYFLSNKHIFNMAPRYVVNMYVIQNQKQQIKQVYTMFEYCTLYVLLSILYIFAYIFFLHLVLYFLRYFGYWGHNIALREWWRMSNAVFLIRPD